jgi:hypothetical protein
MFWRLQGTNDPNSHLNSYSNSCFLKRPKQLLFSVVAFLNNCFKKATSKPRTSQPWSIPTPYHFNREIDAKLKYHVAYGTLWYVTLPYGAVPYRTVSKSCPPRRLVNIASFSAMLRYGTVRSKASFALPGALRERTICSSTPNGISRTGRCNDVIRILRPFNFSFCVFVACARECVRPCL